MVALLLVLIINNHSALATSADEQCQKERASPRKAKESTYGAPGCRVKCSSLRNGEESRKEKATLEGTVICQHVGRGKTGIFCPAPKSKALIAYCQILSLCRVLASKVLLPGVVVLFSWENGVPVFPFRPSPHHLQKDLLIQHGMATRHVPGVL